MISHTGALAKHAATVSFDGLDAGQQALAGGHILDALGALAYGPRLPRIAEILESWLSFGGALTSPAAVPGLTAVGSLPAVAGASAALAHVAEIDTIHGPSAVCIGASIIPPMVMLAHARGATGRSFADAVVTGHEVGARLGEAVHGQEQFARGRWPTALAAPIAVAAASARLIGLDIDGIELAIGSAALGTGGLLAIGRNEPESRHLLLAGAVRMGMEAALATEAGITGPPRMLDGPDGLCRSLTDTPDMEALVRDSLPKIVETGIKPYGCGRQTQAAVRALVELMAAEVVPANDVERIDLTLPTPAAFFNRPTPPENRMEAVCSVQFTLALAARKPDFLPHDFEEDLFLAEQLALMGKVSCKIDDAFGKAHPGTWPARVQVYLKGGRTLERLCPVAPGDPGAELTAAERQQKFMRLATPRLGADRATHLTEAIAMVDTLPDVAPVLAALNAQETVS